MTLQDRVARYVALRRHPGAKRADVERMLLDYAGHAARCGDAFALASGMLDWDSAARSPGEKRRRRGAAGGFAAWLQAEDRRHAVRAVDGSRVAAAASGLDLAAYVPRPVRTPASDGPAAVGGDRLAARRHHCGRTGGPGSQVPQLEARAPPPEHAGRSAEICRATHEQGWRGRPSARAVDWPGFGSDHCHQGVHAGRATGRTPWRARRARGASRYTDASYAASFQLLVCFANHTAKPLASPESDGFPPSPEGH